jgi:hypothetical protein
MIVDAGAAEKLAFGAGRATNLRRHGDGDEVLLNELDLLVGPP